MVRIPTIRRLCALLVGTLVPQCADVDGASAPVASVVPWELGARAVGEITAPPRSVHPPPNTCGPCGRPCGALDVCVSEVCVPSAGVAPRLLLPASLGRVTSLRPTFRWLSPAGSDGARLEVCRDRACSDLVARVESTTSSATLAAPLAAGVYFWRVVPRVQGEYSRKTSHTWSFVARRVNSEVDTSFGRLNDLNGDGYADVLISTAPSRPVGVWLGGPDGVSRAPSWVIPTRVDGHPARASAVGDLNGDGYADLLLRVSLDDDTSRVLLIPGAARPRLDRAIELHSAAGWARSLYGAGDLDGDGYADLLGVDPERGGSPATLRVWYGTPGGVWAQPRTLVEGVQGADFAHAVATLGDLNGDTLPDLLLGAPRFGDGQGRAVAWINGRCREGALVDLGASGVAGARRGDTVALAGDADGDGFVEAIAAEPFSPSDIGRGRLQLFHGARDAIAPTPARVLPFEGPQTEGLRLVAGGDYDGDGYSDLVVWMHNEQRGPSFRIFPGGARGAPTRAARVVYPQEFGATETALSTALAGDTDRDGYDDLVVMLAPGQVLVARGGPDGLRVGPAPLLALPEDERP